MVVLAASVLTRQGKTLVSRQFLPMTRIRIEGLLAAFPKLLNADSQSTFVETDQVRYVYQPLESLYVLLVTSKQSNIMEDLETLRLVVKLVPECCGASTESAVTENLYELVFALDEVMSLGHKEHVSLQQIRTFVEMDSHEEKLQKIIMESKMNEARDEGIRKAEELDKRKMEQRKLSNNSAADRYEEMFNNPRGMGSMGRHDDDSQQAPPEPVHEPVKPKVTKQNKPARKAPKGMSLKKKKVEDDFINQFAKEEKLSAQDFQKKTTVASSAPVQKEAVQVNHSHPHVEIEESLICVMDSEGELKKLEVKGEMKLIVMDPDESRCVLQTQGLSNLPFKFRFNPKVAPKEWDSKQLIVKKNRDDAFAVGSDNATVVAKWLLRKNDEALVPLSINFWPNQEDGQSVVSVDYTLNRPEMVLKRVTVVIPCRTSQPPEIRSIGDNASHHYDHKERVLVWGIAEISEQDDAGSFEFSVPEVDDESFYPITVHFTSESTYSGIEITSVAQAADETQTMEFTQNASLMPSKFEICLDE